MLRCFLNLNCFEMKTSKADKYFSLFIRLRDADENGLARCCTCGKLIDVKYSDCGHYIKRQHMATRFDERNCACQCKRCNAFEQGRDTEFADFIEKKYGGSVLIQLKLAGRSTKKFNKFELDQIAKYYKQAAEKLAKEKGIELW